MRQEGEGVGHGEMPGRLIMDPQGATGSQDLKKDRSHAQEAPPAQQDALMTQIQSAQESPQVNGSASHGQNGTLPNGIPAPNGGLPTMNGAHMDSSMASPDAADLSQLDQSWRHTQSNKSLGTLMDRVAQQCYTDLNETLTQMSEVGPDQGAPQANGLLSQAQQDTSESSLKKKRLLMDFAHNQRDRFTKTLVLSDWARNGDEMANIIDIKVWQDKQRWAYTLAANEVGETKRKMIDFKVPAPNLEGAMEVLSTGKASWIPDLGYIPPKRLTAKQLMKTLKGMNVTLATRLNLHDELPPHMEDFTVADGRATFSVPGEFEVDLSVADEDPTSPFYFIDIRFLFSPSPDALHDQLRVHLETRVNAALATKGLQGCYDFLHNFVLTHKINILRTQAQDLIRHGKWFDCIKVEHMRRSLVVQYWAGSPGLKNWFEIGISSGKHRPSSRKKPTPRLSVRWFRKGHEVLDEQLDFDSREPDLEVYLIKVIAKHCFGKLAVARDGVCALAPESKVLKADMTEPEIVPEECRLSLSLLSTHCPLAVRIEPVTGHISISPPSAASLNSERVLNNDPNVDMPRVLASLACQVVQEQIRKQVELLGWQEIHNLTSVRAKLGSDVLQRSVFHIQGWGQQWALAVSFSLNGEKWWIAQLQDAKSHDRGGPALKEVTNVRQLTIPDAASDKPSTNKAYRRASLLRIERLAVAEVSYTVLSQQIRTLRIPHTVEKPAALTEGPSSDRRSDSTSSATVLVPFSPLMRDGRDKSWKGWVAGSVRLTHHGIEDVGSCGANDVAKVRHDFRLSLVPGTMKCLRQHLTRATCRDVAINATGGLAVRMRTPFGEPLVEQIQRRLQHGERINRYVGVLQNLGFTCTYVGFARLAFTYSMAPHLSAQLLFAVDGSLPARLKLEPKDSNPHQRVRVILEQVLNRKDFSAFSEFANALPLTLPLLQTFERLEAADLANRTFVVRSRSATWYSVAYIAPLTACSFELRARSKFKGNIIVVRWLLQEVKSKSGSPGRSGDFESMLKGLWQDKGERWVGLGNSIVADSVGIAAAVEKLDELVRSFIPPVEVPKDVEPAASSAPVTVGQPPQQRARPVGSFKPAVKAEPDVITLD